MLDNLLSLRGRHEGPPPQPLGDMQLSSSCQHLLQNLSMEHLEAYERAVSTSSVRANEKIRWP